MILKHLATASLLVLLFSFFVVAPVYAYLDPGTGSYICQLLLAGVMGALFVLKLYWTRFKAFCASFFKGAKE